MQWGAKAERRFSCWYIRHAYERLKFLQLLDAGSNHCCRQSWRMESSISQSFFMQRMPSVRAITQV